MRFVVEVLKLAVMLYGMYFFIFRTLPRMQEEWLIKDDRITPTKIKLFLLGVSGFLLALPFVLWQFFVNILIQPPRSWIQYIISMCISIFVFLFFYVFYLLYKKESLKHTDNEEESTPYEHS